MKCYLQISGHGWTQEHYDGLTKDAATRARELRKAGFAAKVVDMGMQVTNAGLCKMKMVDVRYTEGQDASMLPKVEVVS